MERYNEVLTLTMDPRGLLVLIIYQRDQYVFFRYDFTGEDIWKLKFRDRSVKVMDVEQIISGDKKCWKPLIRSSWNLS